MDRRITPHILPYLSKKIVLLTGPRQVGKTTLAKAISEEAAYYNFDIKSDAKVFLDQEWDRQAKLVIFDELHKMKKWKLWLKGLSDRGDFRNQRLLVTGSARLDIAKKMGDSLAGRFYSFRLHPLDMKELKGRTSGEENYKRLIECSGFPEPFLEGTEKYYRIWRRTHLDLILRQDLISLESVRDIEGIELLVQLLSERVQSPISVNALAEDMGRDDKTIKRWLDILENLYVIFKVTPKSKNVARSIKKASKYYFYDVARVDGPEEAKLENLVALSLKKEVEFLQDFEGVDLELCYARTKDHKEIDFVVARKGHAPVFIEVKKGDGACSPNFFLFQKFYPQANCIQLVLDLDRAYTSKSGVRVTAALPFLENLDLLGSY